MGTRLHWNYSKVDSIEVTAVCLECGSICISGASVLPVGVSMNAQAVEHDEVAFLELSVTVVWLERLIR